MNYFCPNIKVSKVMKLLSISMTIILFACNSPLDVPANRQIKLKENPYSNPLIKITPSYYDFGFVHPDSSKILELSVENLQTSSYPISEYHLFFGMNNFVIQKKTIPIILGPKGSENSSFKVQVQFNGKNPGKFTDTLIFNTLIYPTATFEAKVPFIYCADLNLECVAGQTKSFKLKINNLSSSEAILNKISISQFSELFSINQTLPIYIPRNSFKEISCSFISDVPGTFQSNLTFDIESNSIKSLTDNSSVINVIVKP
jgi:hypothetical protein